MEQNDIFEEMREMLGDAPVTLPPNSFKDMNAEIVNYEEGRSIEISIPLHEKYNNPAGLILGGYLPVFFDLAFGPLSFLVAKKPTTSLDLNTTFIRPISVKDKSVRIRATIVSQSKTYLIMDAQAFNAKDEVCATATSRSQILC